MGAAPHQHPAHQGPAPAGNSREAGTLALLGVAGPAVFTGATGTAVQGHLAVSALGRKSAVGTPEGAGESQQRRPAPPQPSLPVPGSLVLSSTPAPTQEQEPFWGHPGRVGSKTEPVLPAAQGAALRHRLSLPSPCSRRGRYTCTLQGGHCGSCPGSGMGWTGRGHTWPGQPEWGRLRQSGGEGRR